MTNGPMEQPQAAAPDVDLAIENYRKEHGAVLSDSIHPRHKQAVDGLSKLYEAKFGGSSRQLGDSTPDRFTADTAANDKLASAFPDRGVDDVQRMVEPAQQPTDYTFDVPLPPGWERVEGSSLESWSREWLHAAEVSPAEGKALTAEFITFGNLDPDQAARMAATTERDLRQRYGADVGKVAAAALKAADDFPELSVFLDSSGLFNSPRVIGHLIRVAEKRGYIERTSR